MSLSLIVGCLWVVAAAVVAMLPMRAQFPPGIALLVAAPCLLAWIAVDHGAWIFGAGLFAFLSMFRHFAMTNSPSRRKGKIICRPRSPTPYFSRIARGIFRSSVR